MQTSWRWSHTCRGCWSCHSLPETQASWGGWNPHGQLLGHQWARNVPSENLSHHQSHVHGDPQQLQLYSPCGEGWTQERTSVHGLRLERKCFTITPSQTESQVNLSNNLKLGNVPLFYWAMFCFEFLHLPSLSPGSLVSGQVCPVFQGTHTDWAEGLSQGRTNESFSAWIVLCEGPGSDMAGSQPVSLSQQPHQEQLQGHPMDTCLQGQL